VGGRQGSGGKYGEVHNYVGQGRRRNRKRGSEIVKGAASNRVKVIR